MDRKKFLLNSSIAVCALGTFGSVTASESNNFVGDCETTNDILGPFYRPNAPTRSVLLEENKSGSIVTIKGTVFSDCDTPLKNALVEIWHCDVKGAYDNESDKFMHRAKWQTNEEGEYRFITILPGKYKNGRIFRPAHIHFRVSAKNHKELISQVYFAGDPHITEDPWASQDKAKFRILPIQLEDTNGNLAVNFNIYLSKKG